MVRIYHSTKTTQLKCIDISIFIEHNTQQSTKEYPIAVPENTTIYKIDCEYFWVFVLVNVQYFVDKE